VAHAPATATIDALFVFISSFAAPAGLSPWFQSIDPPTELDAKGAAAGFVVAVPEAAWGTGKDGLPPRRWSSASERGDPAFGAAAPPYDDVAFLWAVAACVRDTLRVRLSSRVYAMGWSQGGKLASALACSPGAHGFAPAAAAIGAGLMACDDAAGGALGPPPPLPLLVMQGGADVLVPFCVDGVAYRAGALAVAAWASPARNGCDTASWRALCGDGLGVGSGIVMRVYTAPCARAPLALYWLAGQPHMLPFGNLPGLAGGMPELFIAFFRSVERGAPDVTPLGGTDGAPLGACDALHAPRVPGGPCAEQAAAAWSMLSARRR
jgi:poly(3-hydroxybutyrate) depolymerase